jgi:catechol 2,3-dioxygenase-like lactoylglutathione lyase family enzyme
LSRYFIAFLCLLAVPRIGQAQTPPAISGLYEVCIGTRDELAHIRYWQRFGYRVGEMGELSAADARRLYGVNSRLRSIRLHHQDADHGLVRLMVWETPVNDGLALSRMRVLGNRWAAMMTNDLYNVFNHVEAMSLRGSPIYFTEPLMNVMPLGGKNDLPFVDPIHAIREFAFALPETRHVIYQRFNYTRPLYGRVNESSFFRASQVTHAGLVTDCAQEQLAFYDEVLGLLRTEDNQRSDHTNQTARRLFELQPGESYSITSFDDPRSSREFAKMRSGRLIVFRFPTAVKVEEKRPLSRPGSIGLSLYTLRVRDIASYHARLKGGAAAKLTEIVRNEFGERSVSFVAPDGYFWTLVGD